MGKERILFVSSSGPLPATDGKRQRTLALLKALEQVYDVDFLILNNRREYDLALAGYQSPQVRFFSFTSQMNEWIARLKRKLGWLYIGQKKIREHIAKLQAENRYRFALTRYIDPVVHIPAGIPIVCDIDDDFSEVYATQIHAETCWKKRLRLRRIYLTNRFIHSHLLSRIKLPIYSKVEASRKEKFVLSNLPFQLLFQPPMPFRASEQTGFLFVGKLTYEPNLKGALWLLSEVWPRLRKQLPAAHLTLISNVPPNDPRLQKLAEGLEDVRLLINVDNVQEVYQQHAIVLAPVFEGGGSSIKTVESLFMGRPVITTYFGARGFEEAAACGLILRHDEPEKFVEAALRCVESPAQLEKIQREAFAWARSRYNLQDWNNKLQQALREMA